MGVFDFLKGKPKPPGIPPEALMIWVHRRSHFELLDFIGKRRGFEPMKARSTSRAYAFTTALATDKGPLAVTSEHLNGLGMSADEALRRAMQNLIPAFSQAQVAEGLAIFETENQYAGGGLVVAPLLAKHLPLKGQPVVVFPEANLLLIAGEDDLSALERMADVAERAFDGSADYRSLKAVKLEGPAVSDWLPPEGHPLRGRFRRLAAKTQRRELEAQHDAYGFKDRAKLAYLSVRPDGELVAAWARDSSVMLPEVDRVVLLDTPDSPHASVEIDFPTLKRFCASALEGLRLNEAGAIEEAEEDDAARPPLFWRTRAPEFPTARVRAFLQQRATRGATSEREVPSAELLTAIDAGEPIHLEVVPPGQVRLTAPDGRVAELELGELPKLQAKLAAEDQADLVKGSLALALLGLAKGAAPQTAGRVGELSRELQRLAGEAEQQRVPVLSSLAAKRVEEELANLTGPTDDGSEQARTLALLSRIDVRMLEPTSLFPVLRPPGYAEAQRANVAGMATPPGGVPPVIHEPSILSGSFHDGLTLEFVCDRGESLSPIPADRFPAEQHDTVRRTALLNLRAASLDPLIPLAPGVFEAPWRDGYTASRLLVPEVFAKDVVKGERLLFAPSVNRVWLTGSEDAEGISRVLEAINEYLWSGGGTSPYAWRELLLGRPWVLRDGALSAWQPPADHPALAKLRALEAEVARRRTTGAANAFAFAQSAQRTGPETAE